MKLTFHHHHHRLDITLTVDEAVGPNKPKPVSMNCFGFILGGSGGDGGEVPWQAVYIQCVLYAAFTV